MSQPIDGHKIRPEIEEWRWQDRIAKGRIHIIAGRPDQGKSTLAQYLAAQVSLTERVLYSPMEDTFGTVRNRVVANGGNLRNLKVWPFMLPTDFDELAHYVESLKIGLVVMDPFAAHLSGRIKRGSDNVREVTTPLKNLIERTGTSVVIVEHVNKRVNKNEYPLNAITGSGSGVVAAARAAFVFGQDPTDEDGRYLCTVKMNMREWEKSEAMRFELDSADVPIGDGRIASVPRLTLEGDCSLPAMRILTLDPETRGPGRPASKREAAQEWLTVYLLTNGKTKASKILADAQKAGMSPKTVKNAARDMEVVKDPVHGGQNCTWDLSDELREAMTEGMTFAPDDDVPLTVPEEWTSGGDDGDD